MLAAASALGLPKEFIDSMVTSVEAGVRDDFATTYHLLWLRRVREAGGGRRRCRGGLGRAGRSRRTTAARRRRHQIPTHRRPKQGTWNDRL